MGRWVGWQCDWTVAWDVFLYGQDVLGGVLSAAMQGRVKAQGFRREKPSGGVTHTLASVLSKLGPVDKRSSQLFVREGRDPGPGLALGL